VKAPGTRLAGKAPSSTYVRPHSEESPGDELQSIARGGFGSARGWCSLGGLLPEASGGQLQLFAAGAGDVGAELQTVALAYRDIEIEEFA